MNRILIVGGGVAAAALVASLRRRGFASHITVLCAEDRLPYDRPPLSKELLTRNEPAGLHGEFAIADGDADWILGTTAAELMPQDGASGYAVLDTAGTLWEAEQIVLATGVAPVSPWAGARTLYSWDDADALRSTLGFARSVAIVGAGWLGLELASVLRKHGLSVTLIDAEDGPLRTVLPREVAERIETWLVDAGVRFLGRSPVASITPGIDTSWVVTTGSGAETTADTVIAALGSAPQTAWLPQELLTPAGHVAADADGRVRDGLWAIGDCAETAGAAHPHWNDAVAGAERCAAAIVGDEQPAGRAPHGFSTMFGHDIQMLGNPSPAQETEFVETASGWVANLTEHGELRAVFAIDSPRDVAKARRALA